MLPVRNQPLTPEAPEEAVSVVLQLRQPARHVIDFLWRQAAMKDLR